MYNAKIVKVAFLEIFPARRKYNTILLRALSLAGIKYETRYSSYGKGLFVSINDAPRADTIIGRISLDRPEYSEIKNYIK
jgi:hypothetical protein